MVRRSNTNLCLVCESAKAICQFGALSCRSCAAFFRRLVLSNRKYYCDCETKLKEKVETAMARKQRISKCRGCRMRRCYEAGMKEEIVRSGCQNSLCKMDNGRENKKIDIFREDDKGAIFIKILLEIVDKAYHIYLNVLGFSNHFLDKYPTFEHLIQSKDNLLAHADFYKKRPFAYFYIAQFEENIMKHGLFHTEPVQLTKALLLTIDIAKAMPSFSRLCLKDQITLVSGYAPTASIILSRFNSMKMNTDTDMMEVMNYPFVRLYTKINSEDPVIKHLAEAIFDIPMKDFRKIGPNKEEMVLLLALLFANTSIPSLSNYGQQIMDDESEKCAKILLRYQQAKFGEQRGALRYAECLQLLWNTIGTSQKHKELIVYIDTFYEQGRLEALMPKILIPLAI